MILSKVYWISLLPTVRLPQVSPSKLKRVTFISSVSATITKRTESTVRGALNKPIKKWMASFCLGLTSHFTCLPVWRRRKESKLFSTKRPSSRLPKRGATCSWKTSQTTRLKMIWESSLDTLAKLSHLKSFIQRSSQLKSKKMVNLWELMATHLCVSQHQTAQVWLRQPILHSTEDLFMSTTTRLNRSAKLRMRWQGTSRISKCTRQASTVVTSLERRLICKFNSYFKHWWLLWVVKQINREELTPLNKVCPENNSSTLTRISGRYKWIDPNPMVLVAVVEVIMANSISSLNEEVSRTDQDLKLLCNQKFQWLQSIKLHLHNTQCPTNFTRRLQRFYQPFSLTTPPTRAKWVRQSSCLCKDSSVMLKRQKWLECWSTFQSKRSGSI